MRYVIDRIAVVRRGRWFSFRRNEVTSVISSDRARSWMQGKTPMNFIAAGGGAEDAAQRNALALADVEDLVRAGEKWSATLVIPASGRSNVGLAKGRSHELRNLRSGRKPWECY